VAFATEERFCGVVEQCGFVAAPAGLDPFAPAPYKRYEFSEPVTQRKVEDILGIAARRQYHLIVRDPTDFSAVIAAEALGIPQATIGFSRFCVTRWWRRVFGSSLDSIRHQPGITPDPEMERLYPWLYLDTVPPWLQEAEGPPVDVLYRIRPEPYQAPPPPGILGIDKIPDEPIVLVTLGTVYNRRLELLERLCQGVLRAGTKVICTLGPRRGGQSSPALQVRGVQVADNVPLRDILPHCAAVVTHGAYSTVPAAILQGVPLMLVPLGADNAYNAKRCAREGAGLTEAPETVTGRRVAELVSMLVTQPEFRNAAERLGARTAALPGAAAVPILERLGNE
jgi:UDP:flavonoid glycosyltransferase YjiC (YdhE family)